jgi:cytochrome c oxidase subunit 2
MRTTTVALAASLIALLALAPAASAAFGMPDALTSRGQAVEGLYTIIAILGITVFLIVFAWLVAVIVRFREGTGHGRATHEKERHNAKAEALWIGVPLVMVLWIGYAAYGAMVGLDHGIPLDQAQMEIRVTGSQWNWQFDYGSNVRLFSNPDPMDGNVSAENTFLVPQGTNILFNITSADVIHAFQVLDANRAYVLFNDANPLGANKYALQTVNLPAGDYFVQCNKMCLNPGHAYMHAAIKAVPKAQFDHWFAQKRAEGGANLLQHLAVEAKADGLHLAGNPAILNDTFQVAAGMRIVVDVKADRDVTLTATGAAPKTFRAGEAVDTFYAFDAKTPGTYTLIADNGGIATFTATAAIPKTVTLSNFKLTPDALQVEAGKTYLIQVPNAGMATHDLHIGHYNGGANPEILAHSPSVGAGGSAAFLWTPKEKGTFDMWCNQSGHAALGMVGTVTVG